MRHEESETVINCRNLNCIKTFPKSILVTTKTNSSTNGNTGLTRLIFHNVLRVNFPVLVLLLYEADFPLNSLSSEKY